MDCQIPFLPGVPTPDRGGLPLGETPVKAEMGITVRATNGSAAISAYLTLRRTVGLLQSLRSLAMTQVRDLLGNDGLRCPYLRIDLLWRDAMALCYGENEFGVGSKGRTLLR